MACVRAGLKKRREQREKELAQRKEDALAGARRAAAMIRAEYGCRVLLFGSLARGGRFNEHSDIDLALEGLPVEANFWRLYAGALTLVEPFHLDLVLLESASPELQGRIRQEGVEI
ncbi:hypothetical protein A6M21_15350 [Desulfotomaculum copahuensis]|uniref:Polymerase beta nucleotidyltransferase domain-containing protein n=1 Tax=Desulfotomaculum copahuensis TaxID=1838280 RepID=A0A1B7LBI1_9FIRM|nr:hypothetical protein A6M21_15350 [Desulfotomaculum copahuensis]